MEIKYKDMSMRQKIKEIRKISGLKTHLSWADLCGLTEFDSFNTCLAFGLSWNENCPDNRLVAMNEKFINMILFNITNYPKGETKWDC